MKKVLVLGSGGMLGHMVYSYLTSLDKYELIDSSYPQKAFPESTILDVTKKTDLENYINQMKPNIVVNCIGVLIRGSGEDPSNAIYLNSYLPHQLSKLMRKTGGKLIHISTDCVFSGEKGTYIETDFKDARDTYGLSKALGEVDNKYDLTLRTSIIGPELKENGEGLFHWFMCQSGMINGFTKTFWGGVTTLELAKAIVAAIEQDITGLIHITNGLPISKYEMLSYFKDIWHRKDVKINPIEGKRSDKSLKSIRSDFKYIVPSYFEMFEELYKWMKLNSNLYEKYLS
ncbi:dTDP-4-dehydrorhamnose reductase family protein [Lutibacter sp.]